MDDSEKIVKKLVEKILSEDETLERPENLTDSVEFVVTDPEAKKLGLDKDRYFLTTPAQTPVPNFTKTIPLKSIEIKKRVPLKFELEPLLRESLLLKLQGMAVITKELFGNTAGSKIRGYYTDAKLSSNLNEIFSKERSQARSFWNYIKKYAQRRRINFEKRIYQVTHLDKLDIINYRCNILGTNLRKETLKLHGTGYDYFMEFFEGHKEIRSLDLVEPIRPLLYFLVLRSLSAPRKLVEEIADELIAQNIEWTGRSIASISARGTISPQKISFSKLIRYVKDELSKHGILNWKPYPSRKVTNLDKDNTMVILSQQTPLGKKGEKIHFQLLKEFPQIHFIPEDYVFSTAYHPLIFAEFPIRSGDHNIRGRTDIIIFGRGEEEIASPMYNKEVALVADLKTYRKRISRVSPSNSHVFQVENYSKLLKVNEFDTTHTVKALIYVNRRAPPVSIRNLIEDMINSKIRKMIPNFPKMKSIRDESTKSVVFLWR